MPWFRSRRSVRALEAELAALRRSSKMTGYALGRSLAPRLRNVDTTGEPRIHGLVSQAATQSDLESPWAAYWTRQIRFQPAYHRKLWEFVYVLQALYEHGQLAAGHSGLGFGCGEEPIPSYLASIGIHVTATDLDPAGSAAKGWVETGQHASRAHRAELVDRSRFDALVRLEHVDMNAIPPHLAGFDFCWSCCALEHLGSIERGLRFVERSLGTLKPRGIAVHTTEWNFGTRGETISRGPTVLFLREHLEDLKARLERSGHRVAPLRFELGDAPLDHFVDVPPYATLDRTEEYAHLRLLYETHPCTSFGMIVEAAGPAAVR